MSEKTISRNRIWGFAVYSICYFGGFTPALLIVGLSIYFGAIEKSQYTAKSVLRAFLVPLVFYLFKEVVMIIPDMLSTILSMTGLYEFQDAFSTITMIASAFTSIASILEALILVAFLITTVSGSEFRLPILDDIVDSIYERIFTSEEIKIMREKDVIAENGNDTDETAQEENTGKEEEDALDRIFRMQHDVRKR